MSISGSNSESLSEGISIVAEAQIKHTESKDKVAAAVDNLFRSNGELIVDLNIVRFVSSELKSLQFIKDQFRDRRVRSTAKRLLLSNGGKEDGESTYLLFNKQAATVSIAVMCDDPSESALGPIVLRIKSPKLLKVIEWLTYGAKEEILQT